MNKILCLLFIFIFLPSCAPIFVPQSNQPIVTIEQPTTPSPIPNYTATFTETFTPTSFPPSFTPSAANPAPTPICYEGPVEELEFNLPAPSDLKWETVNSFQRLSGLNGPVNAAYPSPDGRWWVIEFVTKRESTQYELSLEEALYVLDSLENKHWIASPNGKDNFHRFDWFPNGDLLWVDESRLYQASADGQDKQAIQAPEPVIEVWLDKITGSHALVGGPSALWRLDLSSSRWEKVQGLEGLAKNGEPPISQTQANLRMSNDGSFGALLADHQVWKVPMAFGEPAHKIGEVDYSDESWRPEAPQPLADSPYWYPGRDAYDPRKADSQERSLVLINEEDGSLLSLEDIVPTDFGNFLSLHISPNGSWVSIYNGERFNLAAIYIAPASQLKSGKVITDVGYILDWDVTEVRSSYPGRVNHPDIAFVTKGDFLAGTATLDQIDLATGETRLVKELLYTNFIPILKMTWVNNTPILTEGEIIFQIAEAGTFQPIGKVPEIQPYEYPKLLTGGTKDQLLFTTAVDKAMDNICRTQYSLYIAKLDSIK